MKRKSFDLVQWSRVFDFVKCEGSSINFHTQVEIQIYHSTSTQPAAAAMESLSNLTAEELNEAIDDRNFPRPSQSASNSLSNSLDHGDDGEQLEDGRDKDALRSRRDSRSAVSENGHMNGKWANRPKPLDLNGTEKMYNVPGSSQTPRTSTTPGR